MFFPFFEHAIYLPIFNIREFELKVNYYINYFGISFRYSMEPL